jgi:hypothetical protein
VPLCDKRRSTGMYAGRGVLEVVCPGVRNGDAERRGRNRARMRPIVMPSARIAGNDPVATRSGRGHGGARRYATTSQTVASEQTKTSTQAIRQPLYSSLQDEPYIGSGETASVIDAINRQAGLVGQLASIYPYNSKQSDPAPLRVIRLQQRCNLDSRRNVRTRFFHRICNLAGPMDTPLCKISF